MASVAVIPCANLWKQWRVTVGHKWAGIPQYEQPTRHWLAVSEILTVTSGTPPSCYTSQFPNSYSYNRYNGNTAVELLTGAYPGPNTNCEEGNPRTLATLVDSDYAGDGPFEEWDIIWLNGATATYRVEMSGIHDVDAFRSDWESLEAQAGNEWDNPLMFDPTHSSAYTLAYDASGNPDWVEDGTLGEPVSGCACLPSPITCTASYTTTAISGAYYQVYFERVFFKVNPLLQWSRGLQERNPAPTWTAVSCANGSTSTITRTEFPSPAIVYHTPGGATQQFYERYVYTWGAQCP